LVYLQYFLGALAAASFRKHRYHGFYEFNKFKMDLAYFRTFYYEFTRRIGNILLFKKINNNNQSLIPLSGVGTVQENKANINSFKRWLK
jgi:hypothetical protein